MSILEHLPSRVMPGTHGSEFQSSSGVMLSPIRVTHGSLAQPCHSWSSCPVMSLLELLSANFLFPEEYRFLPVVSLLDLLPSHVTPGALAGEFLISSGVLLSPSRVTPGSLAQSCHSWSSCLRISYFQRRIRFSQS